MAPDERTLVAPPSTRRIYSNAGFEVVGDLLAEATGMTTADYLREAVLVPLAMDATNPRRLARVGGGLERPPIVARFATELLTPTLIAPTTLDDATTVQLPGLDGVLPGFGRQSPNDWGLGFELRDAKRPHWTAPAGSPRTFGHFGRSGTFLWIDPDARRRLRLPRRCGLRAVGDRRVARVQRCGSGSGGALTGSPSRRTKY